MQTESTQNEKMESKPVKMLELKDEGNKAYVRKDYDKAVKLYR